jgi:hypothetical protein
VGNAQNCLWHIRVELVDGALWIARRRSSSAADSRTTVGGALCTSIPGKKTLDHFALISVPCSAFQFASWGTGSPDWLTTTKRRRGDRGAAGGPMSRGGGRASGPSDLGERLRLEVSVPLRHFGRVPLISNLTVVVRSGFINSGPSDPDPAAGNAYRFGVE